MTIDQTLHARSDSQCELCHAQQGLSVYAVPPQIHSDPDHSLLVCATCRGQIEGTAPLDADHWRCLNDSMWTPVPAVQAMAWRLLGRLDDQSWAQDLLAILYLEEEVLTWAKAENTPAAQDDHPATVDSNGAPLADGDSVTLIKDLVVKGAGFTAKRGTAVRGISLTDNPEQIEGRVNGVRIVLLTCFLKKAG